MSGAFVLVLRHKDINASQVVERLKVKLTSALCFLPYRGLKGFKIGVVNEEEGVRRGVHKVRWLTFAMGERGHAAPIGCLVEPTAFYWLSVYGVYAARCRSPLTSRSTKTHRIATFFIKQCKNIWRITKKRCTFNPVFP